MNNDNNLPSSDQAPNDKSLSSLNKPTGNAANKAKMTAFSLMLVVPVALTGCGEKDQYCQYDRTGKPFDCQDEDYYYSSSGGYYSSHSYKKSSSRSHSGFGSSGSSHSFFGG